MVSQLKQPESKFSKGKFKQFELLQVQDLINIFSDFTIFAFALLSIIIKIMNRLVFNPYKEIIEQWSDVYLNVMQINKFQSLIDQLYVYLDIVLTHKIKFLQKQSKQNEVISGEKRTILQGITLPNKSTIAVQDSHPQKHEIEDVCLSILEITKLKETFMLDYENIFQQKNQMQKRDTQNEEFILNLVAKYKNPKNYKEIKYSNINFDKIFEVFEGYFSKLESDTLRLYSSYLDRNDQLIKIFIDFKVQALKTKIFNFKLLKKEIMSKESKKDVSELKAKSYYDIKTLFENLFIQGHYLYNFISYNSNVFDRFVDVDSNVILLEPIRKRHKQKMQILQERVEEVRRQIRETYISLYDTTKAQRSDPNRLQRFICNEVAVNKEEFSQGSHRATFVNGLFFAILLVSLAGILVFRGISLSKLEQSSTYTREFKIWRGASYLIFINWIIAIVLTVFEYCKINYKLVMLEADTFVPKPQAFYQTAIILSSIYLILFLAYLLKAVNIIEGYDLMQNLGYFMWLINIVFMLNPFKILNYEGRKYFIMLIAKVFVSPFRFINFNIFLVAMVFDSFIQPFSDFSFTVCSLVYSSNRECLKQAQTATFIYTLIILTIGCGQCIRYRMQIETQKIFSAPIFCLIADLSAINNVIASFLYNVYLTDQLFIYWIISAVVATITGVNADIRAYWGLVSFEQKGYSLRAFLTLPTKVYYIGMVIDLILSVGWVFTLSNNLSFSDSINPVYFLMILSYIELGRRGLWLIFRIEDDHSINVGNLDAQLNDQPIYDQLKQRHGIIEKAAPQKNISQQLIGQSPAELNIKHKDNHQNTHMKLQNGHALSQLQSEILHNKNYLQKVKQLQQQLKQYLSAIHSMYLRLNLQDHI